MKVEVPVSRANRLINPGCVVMVSSVHRSKPNIIVLAWQMPTSHNPMLVAISVAKKHYSHELIENSGEFVVNVPTEKLLKEVVLCGTKSGREFDKFELTGLTAIPARKVKPPLIQECIGHLECRVTARLSAGDHTIFVGEVLQASCDKGLFDECWDVNNERAKFLLHLGGNNFTIPQKRIVAK